MESDNILHMDSWPLIGQSMCIGPCVIGQIRSHSGCKNTGLGLVDVRVSYAVRLAIRNVNICNAPNAAFFKIDVYLAKFTSVFHFTILSGLTL